MLAECITGIVTGMVEMLVIAGIWKKYDIFSVKSGSRKQWAVVVLMSFLTVFLHILMFRRAYRIPARLNIMQVYVILAILAGIDYRRKVIPNRILAAGAVIRTLLLFLEWLADPEQFGAVFLNAAAGFVFGLLFLLLLSFLTRRGIGYGDVKLFAWIGYSVGLLDAYSILFYSALAAAIAGAYLLLVKKAGKKTELPFAPFVYIGCYLVFWMTFLQG